MSIPLDNVNLSEMIQLDKVESLLNSILRRLDRQDELIYELQVGAASNISRATFERFGSDMQRALASESERIAAVERASHAIIDDEE